MPGQLVPNSGEITSDSQRISEFEVVLGAWFWQQIENENFLHLKFCP